MFKFYKPKIWKRILGRLGFKKYQINYFYGIDFTTGDDLSCEVSGYCDKDGIFNVKSFKLHTPRAITKEKGMG